MKTHIINGIKLELYESADELPAHRYVLLNKFMLIDSGVGSDLNDFGQKIAKISKLIDINKENARTELMNLYQSVYMIAEMVNPKLYSYVCFIHKIGNEVLPVELTEEDVTEYFKRINTEKVSILKQTFEGLKKKLMPN